MSWLFYALATGVLWALWSFLGKIALKTTTPIQATMIFGLLSAAIAVVPAALGQRTASWAPAAIWIAVISGLCGGAGLVTFYMALERGKASLVVPLVGVYPAVVAVLSVALLGDRLTAVQAAGIALAVTGVVLIGTGG